VYGRIVMSAWGLMGRSYLLTTEPVPGGKKLVLTFV
jgi:hypothetical protein